MNIKVHLAEWLIKFDKKKFRKPTRNSYEKHILSTLLTSAY